MLFQEFEENLKQRIEVNFIKLMLLMYLLYLYYE